MRQDLYLTNPVYKNLPNELEISSAPGPPVKGQVAMGFRPIALPGGDGRSRAAREAERRDAGEYAK
ncbi:hypothetical protein ACPOL_1130 [Acidisarcina polymorpha]|uniref:Uncharacterized protein n=1 Tax=Acidisarcina polymorpha TaxID=2211140 RepID=A0A2Z5FUE0_9BACT|nr:hypothetical protein ACPOL_1130 [Acidisarcina polymorpha]